VVTENTTHQTILGDSLFDACKSLLLQSADIVVNEGQNLTSEVLTFVDNSSGEIDDAGYVHNSLISSGSTTNTDLEHFLRRPTLIDSRTWTTATANGVLGSVLEPWYLYLNNAVILNKLRNYAFLRAKLCIKVIINATPFHYGCLRVAYEPNVNAANTGDRKSKIRTNLVSPNPLIIPYSQLPGAWIMPADNSGGEIHVPYFRHSSWLPLNSAADVKTMGILTYYTAFPLTVASASGSTSVTIDTFAWLEDVELSGSTAELSLQSKDEYDGPVSRVASAISDISGKMVDIPVIGKFARATQIGTSAMASIAGMFGFTNTPVIDDVHGMVPLPGAHLASSEISTPVQKLALDPKQELSIDPTLHGLSNQDELAINYITSQKSAIVMDGWSTADAVGTVLFNARVSPMLFGTVPVVDGGAVTRANRVYHTPLSYLGAAFTHWRGDIIFELEVICTKFHKGRLKIAWDPLGSSGITALPENTVYTTILDIGENNKARFRVPYHQAFEFQRLRGPDSVNWTIGNVNPTLGKFDNGLFIVSVLTPLMSPVSPQNIGILISVVGAENLEFANPKAFLGTGGIPPSLFDVQAKDEVDMVAQEVVMGDSGSRHEHRYDLNFGERIPSLRSLLHRYSLYDVSTMEKQGDTRVSLFTKSFTRLPPTFGFDPSGKSSAVKLLVAGNANFNFTPTHPITYFSAMYGGMRGSVNYYANTSADLYPYIGDVRIQRLTNTTRASDRIGKYDSGLNTGGNKNAAVRYLNTHIPHCATAGATFTNSQTNAAINWNYPMMSGVNLTYPDPSSSNNGNSNDQTNQECTFMEVYMKQNVANTVTDVFTLTTYAGTGPDFTCLWWLCCPTVDYYVTIPTAA
jgi:hypothetical protein